MQTIVLSNNVDNTGNPSPSSGTVSIVGDSFIIGGELTASVTLTDANGFGGLSYQWEGGDAAGVYTDLAVGDATASVYTIPATWPTDYVSVRVEVVHTDGLGYLSTITSAARLFNQPTEGAISISITPSAGGSYALLAVYTAITNKITDDNGIGAFAYEWLLLREGAESSVGAAESYILAAADIPAGSGALSLKLSLRHTDAFGFESSVFLQTIVLSNNVDNTGNPSPSSGTVSIVGDSFIIGGELTASVTLTDANGFGGLSYQWEGGDAAGVYADLAVGDATASVYTIPATWPTDYVSVRVEVVHTDGLGYLSTITSAARLFNQPTEGAISISITPSAGGSYALSAVYTAVTNSITDNNGIGAFTYEWLLLREGAESSVGAAENYTLAAADIPAGSGALSLKLSLQHTDAFGFESSVFLQTIVLSNNVDNTGNPSPSSGTVSIVGDSFIIDGKLTASVTLTDANGFGGLSYQWEGGDADGVYTDLAVGDATASVYTIPATWPKDYVSVRVEVVHTDGLGYLSTITSAARLFNQPTEGAISISITPSAGGSYALSAVYTAITNKITDANGINTFAYEWLLLREGAESSVGAAESYTLAAADILAGGGGVLSLKLSLRHTDAFGFESSVFLRTIELSDNINTPGNPSPSSGTVSIIGDSFIIGGKLTASVTLTDANGFGGLSYQWEGGDADGVYTDLLVGDATASVYTIPATWPTNYVSVRVEVVHTDGLGYLSTITSAARLFNQPTEGAISIGITPSAGGSYALSAVYTAVTNSITDANGINTFTYEWLLLREGAESSVGAAESYTLAAADIPAGSGALSLKLSLRHTDAFGFESSVFLQTIVLSNNVDDTGNPSPSSGTVSIVGDSFIIDGELTASVTITDANGFGGLSYKWEGGNAAGVYASLAVGDATASVYTIPSNWPKDYVSVRVEVVHTDGLGYLSTITSAARLFNQPTEGAISISITPSAGGSYALSAVYTAITNKITDANGINTFAYEWLLLREGAESSVGAAESYTLAAADILAGGGGVLSLKLSLQHTDAFGFESSVFLQTIELSDNINTPGNPSPSSGTVSIIGDSFIIGGKLTASVTLTDANGFGGLSYQWEGGDAAGVYTDLAVGDATASVYTIPATWPTDYVSVRVEVVHTDGLGYLSTITSAARLFNQPTEGAISINITPSAGEIMHCRQFIRQQRITSRTTMALVHLLMNGCYYAARRNLRLARRRVIF